MANNITIFGRLGRDSDQRFTGAGLAVLEFSVAEDVGFGDKKVTNWWKCSLWGKQAEGPLAGFLKKGQQVVVFGEVTQREFEKDGQKRLSMEIRVNAVQLAGGKEQGQQSAPAPKQNASTGRPAYNPKPVDEFEDDIPF